ncbi:MAG: peptidase M42 [Chloroflexota bacterium]|nr:MAG: peptidase M42 [Chloroflexota bacterium]
MIKLPEIDQEYLLALLEELLSIPSPTGYTEEGISYLEGRLAEFPDLNFQRTTKGALVANWTGDLRTSLRGLTAHVDTLGAMVKEIKANGRLKLSQLGGYNWNTIEGEGCTVISSDGDPVRGTILVTKASSHVYGKDMAKTERTADTMEVRLDIVSTCAEETRQAGIRVGDFVTFDPRIEQNHGFIRSRHLDDKACVACVLAAVQALIQANLQPAQDTIFHFSNYEEVGHGAASGFPEGLKELVTVDMAAVGEGQTSDEFHATLCVKDSGGPYHHGLSQRLRSLADEYEIPYKVDIYPFYGSDGEAYWRAGGDVAVALIGPGVDASHNYERTHQEALFATTRWIMAYLLN